MRHNLFEAQLASDTQVGGAPKLSFELANADSYLVEVERQTGFKGSQLTVAPFSSIVAAGSRDHRRTVVFHGLMNPPDTITETVFRLSAMNRMSMQRTVVPEVRVQRMCPVALSAQRRSGSWRSMAAARGKYSPFYRCGYSPDQPNGVGNLNGRAHSPLLYTRADCEQRGMFTSRFEWARNGPIRGHRICAADNSGARRRSEEFANFGGAGQRRAIQRLRSPRSTARSGMCPMSCSRATTAI